MILFPPASRNLATFPIPLDDSLARDLVGLVVAPPTESGDLLASLLHRSNALTGWALLRQFDSSGGLLESTDDLASAILAAGVARFLLSEDGSFAARATSGVPSAQVDPLDESLPEKLRGDAMVDPRRAFDRAILRMPAWAACDPAIRIEIQEPGGELPWEALPLPSGWRRLWRRAVLRHGVDEASLARATLSAARDGSRRTSPVKRPAPIDPSLAVRTLERVARLVREHESSEVEFRRRLDVERWASMKELAYGASHEINNPLANIASRAQMLAESEQDAERRTKLQAIERQAFRAFTMIQNLMLVADPPKPSPERFDLSRALDRGTAKWSAEAAAKSIRVERTRGPASESWVDADPAQAELVLDELLLNAVEASPPEGVVRVVGPEPVRENFGAGVRDGWLVEIVDEGPGLSTVARERLFDPFYSGREAGRGQGFGLSKARRIVENHGGVLRCRELPRRGLAMQWLLPRAQALTT